MRAEDHEALLDEQRIKNTILRYFAGLDRKSPPMFDQVFTEDATMTALAGGRRFEGRAAIVESMMTVRNYQHTSHYPTSQVIEIDGDSATADTFGIAVIAVSDPEPRILVRGLQYLDDLVRTPEGWRIAHRQHIPTWQYDAESVPAQLPR